MMKSNNGHFRLVRVGLLVVLLAASLLLTLAAGPNDAVDLRKNFKCRRSFDQQLSIKPKHTTKANDCEFGPMTVLRAEATAVMMERQTTPAIRFWMEAILDRPIGNATYTIALKHMATGSKVQYHGFDEKGYSMCCQFVHNATCEWEGYQLKLPENHPQDTDSDTISTAKNSQNDQEEEVKTEDLPSSSTGGETSEKGKLQEESDADSDLQATTLKRQRVVDCVLEQPAEFYVQANQQEGGSQKVVLTGEIVKPVHVLREGRWEVDFRMRDNMDWRLGQVLAWVDLTQTHLGLDKEGAHSLVVVEPDPPKADSGDQSGGAPAESTGANAREDL